MWQPSYGAPSTRSAPAWSALVQAYIRHGPPPWALATRCTAGAEDPQYRITRYVGARLTDCTRRARIHARSPEEHKPKDKVKLQRLIVPTEARYCSNGLWIRRAIVRRAAFTVHLRKLSHTAPYRVPTFTLAHFFLDLHPLRDTDDGDFYVELEFSPSLRWLKRWCSVQSRRRERQSFHRAWCRPARCDRRLAMCAMTTKRCESAGDFLGE